MDATTLTLLITLYPVLFVLVFWLLLKGGRKKETFLVLGLLAMTIFYIFAPDPSVIYRLYTEKGDVATPLIFSTVAAVALFVAVFFFRRHLRE
jgi:hypothetical protein